MKLILKNIFTNRNTCYYLWFALPRANKLKVKVFSGVELHYRDLFHGKIYELLQNLTSGIKRRMINEKKKFFGGYSSEDFCCLWLFLFLRSKYKNEWIDLCAEHGHRWWRKNSHRWSLFQKRVPARCQLEFVRKVDVSYRQSFFEHHSFFIDWAGIICTIQKKLKDSNIDNMDFDHKNWYLSKRIRPIKENEWWSCIAIGSNDHITTSDKVKRDDWPDSRRTILGNYYVAATKYTKKKYIIGFYVTYRKWKRDYN